MHAIRRKVLVSLDAEGIRVTGLDKAIPVPQAWALGKAGTGLPGALLQAGFLDRSISEFEATVTAAGDALASNAENADYRLVPSGGGVLPFGVHFPGSFSDDPDIYFGV